MSGSIQTADLVNGKNMTLLEKKFQTTTDRFGNAESALLFNFEYAIFPPGVYLDPSSGGYTVMLWLKLLNTSQLAEKNQTIIEFGNGWLIDSFSLSSRMRRNLVAYCILAHSTVACSEDLDMTNRWTHITIVYLINGETKLYANGHLLFSAKGESQTFEKVVRGSNFIGYGSNDPDFLFAELNELKIFNRELSSAEINKEMSENNFSKIWKLIVYTSTVENSGSNTKDIEVQLIGSRLNSQRIQLDYAGAVKTNIEGRFQTGSVDEFQLFTANIGIPSAIVLSTGKSVDLHWRLYKVNCENIKSLPYICFFSYKYITLKGNSQRRNKKLIILVLSRRARPSKNQATSKSSSGLYQQQSTQTTS